MRPSINENSEESICLNKEASKFAKKIRKSMGPNNNPEEIINLLINFNKWSHKHWYQITDPGFVFEKLFKIEKKHLRGKTSLDFWLEYIKIFNLYAQLTLIFNFFTVFEKSWKLPIANDYQYARNQLAIFKSLRVNKSDPIKYEMYQAELKNLSETIEYLLTNEIKFEIPSGTNVRLDAVAFLANPKNVTSYIKPATDLIQLFKLLIINLKKLKANIKAIFSNYIEVFELRYWALIIFKTYDKEYFIRNGFDEAITIIHNLAIKNINDPSFVVHAISTYKTLFDLDTIRELVFFKQENDSYGFLEFIKKLQKSIHFEMLFPIIAELIFYKHKLITNSTDDQNKLCYFKDILLYGHYYGKLMQSFKSLALINFFQDEICRLKEHVQKTITADNGLSKQLIQKIQDISLINNGWHKVEFDLDEIKCLKKFLNRMGEINLKEKLLSLNLNTSNIESQLFLKEYFLDTQGDLEKYFTEECNCILNSILNRNNQPIAPSIVKIFKTIYDVSTLQLFLDFSSLGNEDGQCVLNVLKSKQKKFSKIIMHNCSFNDSELKVIFEGNKELQELELKNCLHITVEFIQFVSNECTAFKKLTLEECPKILSIDNAFWTTDGLMPLQETLKNENPITIITPWCEFIAHNQERLELKLKSDLKTVKSITITDVSQLDRYNKGYTDITELDLSHFHGNQNDYEKLDDWLDKHHSIVNIIGSNPVRYLKLALIGRSTVGKSSLKHRFLHNNYCDDFDGTESPWYSSSKNISVQAQEIPFQIYEIDSYSRQERTNFKQLEMVTFAIICFSTVDRSSFDNIPDSYIKKLQELHIPWILVGTQNDRGVFEKISENEAKQKAKELGALTYFACSAKTDNGTDDIIKFITNNHYEKQQSYESIIKLKQKHITNNINLQDEFLKAVKKKSEPGIDSCLSKGIGLYAQDQDGNTALHWAAKNNYFNIAIKLLCLMIKRGVDHKIKNHKGQTALDVAHAKLKGLLEQAFNDEKLIILNRPYSLSSLINKQRINDQLFQPSRTDEEQQQSQLYSFQSKK